MRITELTTHLDELTQQLIDKGYERPVAYYQVQSGERNFIHICATLKGERVSQGDWPKNVSTGLASLRRWVEGLETAEIQAQREAVKKLGKAVDAMRDSGIDANFVDPLADHLQSISKNLLTDQRGVA